MPRYQRIPTSAHEADAALRARRTLRLDRMTRLTRSGVRVEMWCEAWKVVQWSPNGDMRMWPPGPWYENVPALRRIDAALPDDFAIEFRGRRLRPRLVYRGSYTFDLMPVTFAADGSLRFGRGYDPNDALSRAELDREASARDGFTVMPSRRRTPRPLPAYAQRAMLQGSGMDLSTEGRAEFNQSVVDILTNNLRDDLNASYDMRPVIEPTGRALQLQRRILTRAPHALDWGQVTATPDQTVELDALSEQAQAYFLANEGHVPWDTVRHEHVLCRCMTGEPHCVTCVIPMEGA